MLLVPVSVLGAIVAVAIGDVAGLMVAMFAPLLGLGALTLWSVLLAFIALRENYGLTNLRALAAMLIPMGVIGAVIALLALALGSIEVEASFNFNIDVDGCEEVSSPAVSDTPALLPTPSNPAISRVTKMAGSSYQPNWHPSSESLAFISNAGGDWDIYRINLDGSGLFNMTNHPDSDSNPAWSPDGTKIAFNSSRNGDTDTFKIFVMNSDGTGITQLTDGITPSQPTWSPDGAKIAFTSTRSGDLEIYAMNSDGSNVTNISQSPNSREGFPTWSPDGTKIAFVSGDPDGRRTSLQVANADGSATAILLEESNWSKFSWSPSGDALVFSIYPDIFTIKLDGSGLTQLTNDPAVDHSPAWSPDGDKIAFSSGLGGDSDIYFIDLQTAVTTHPTLTPAPTRTPMPAPTRTPTPTPLPAPTPTTMPAPAVTFTPTATLTPQIRFTRTPTAAFRRTPTPTPLRPLAIYTGTIDIPQTWGADLDRGYSVLVGQTPISCSAA